MSNPNYRSHAAHSRGKGAGDTEGVPFDELPSYLLRPETDEMRELLEELDDAIFAALQGSEDSLEKAKTLWPRAIAEIDWELVEESREHYLRFAVETSRRLQQGELRSPERSVMALEIVSLLTEIE
ncbi:MAG: hypothetical protein IH898_04775 [Planctomycetes bacterium]|nr:hypothetical protein [Planctomycetota bacterium]